MRWACVCVCVCAGVRVCVCARACVCVYVTVNAKNNFGDTLDAMFNIACARSVSEHVGRY